MKDVRLSMVILFCNNYGAFKTNDYVKFSCMIHLDGYQTVFYPKKVGLMVCPYKHHNYIQFQ